MDANRRQNEKNSIGKGGGPRGTKDEFRTPEGYDPSIKKRGGEKHPGQSQVKKRKATGRQKILFSGNGSTGPAGVPRLKLSVGKLVAAQPGGTPGPRIRTKMKERLDVEP